MATKIELSSMETEVDVVEQNRASPPRLRRWRGRPTTSRRGSVRPMRYHWYPVFKAAIDRLLALILLLPATPIMLLAAMLIKISSRGPAFYKQTRLGLNGQPFTIYKLRSMVHKCESLTGPRWAMPGDPRITPVGMFLRLSHIDELPQLLNVLRGDMSLIGPRPERPEFLPELEEALPGYRQRLTVRPGVTGLAQVQLPADTDVESVRRKLAYDLYYIQRLSPWLDLRLLGCTLFYALGVPFKLLGKWFGIPSQEEVERQMRGYMLERKTARLSQRNAA